MKRPSSSHDTSAHSNSSEEIGDTYISSRRSSGTNSFFEEREGTATVLGACNNYINLTVGGGVVAIPKAMVLCGYLPGSFMLLAFAFLACLNSLYIIVAGAMTKATSFQNVVQETMGVPAGWVAVFTLFLLNVGACIVTLQVIGHGCSDILLTSGITHVGIEDTIGWDSLAMVVVSTVLVLPLSLLRHVESLELSSYFSNAAVLAFITVMIVQGPNIRSDIDELADITDASLAVDSFQDQVLGMCTIVFNYCTGLSLAFGTYNSLPSRKRTLPTWWKISVITMVTCCCVYLILGIAAAMLFGSGTPDDIILIFQLGDITGIIGILFIVVSGILTFPLNLYTVREIINQTVFVKFLHQCSYPNTVRHATITIVCWAIITVIAILYDGILYVIALNGAICGTAIVLVFPSLVYVLAMRKMEKPDKQETKTTPGGSWLEHLKTYFFPYLSLLIGTFSIIFGTIFSMSDIVSGTESYDGVNYD